MGILDYFKFGSKKEAEVDAHFGAFTPVFSVSYTGEKTPGEIGVVKKYRPDFKVLRERGWQSFFESEITQDIVKKYIIWVVGQGLRVQSEPVKTILETNGIEIGKEFQRNVETRFSLYSKSENGDYSRLSNINKVASITKKNALVSGDVLVILRTNAAGEISVQLIDGENIKGSLIPSKFEKDAVKRGNKIVDGVEVDKKGRHVAYLVKSSDGETKRVLARDRNGRKRAYLVYGSRYRLSHTRGMPLIAVVMETLKKLDRYKEATVASAEERAKIAFSIEHDKDALGESPLQQQIANSLGSGGKTSPSDSSYNTMEGQVKNIALSSEKTVYNLAPGSKLKALESDIDIKFIDFYKPNIDLVCATLGIPPEVALSKYDSNFSASRAALKDWEHTLNVDRTDFGNQFYQPIYEFWLDMQVAKGKINAPGYVEALISGDNEVLAAYRNARFRGASVPHIDPLKEVKAEREKLGELGKNLPLTTAEQAIEALDGGEYELIVEQFKTEREALGEAEENNGV